MSNGKITGVALGPGDPELLTIKGLNVLRESDVIYFPGSVTKLGKKSYALDILDHYNLPNSELKGVYLPMKLDRSAAEKVYSEAYVEIKKDYAKGKKIAFVAEGDITFYSTFAYLIEKIHTDGLDFAMVPGIPAFILAGSQAQIPLAMQSNSLLVLSQCTDIAELEDACNKYSTVILMKPTTIKHNLTEFLGRFEGTFIYSEKLGTADEFISSSISEISGRPMPYFTLLVFKQASKKKTS